MFKEIDRTWIFGFCKMCDSKKMIYEESRLCADCINDGRTENI